MTTLAIRGFRNREHDRR